MLNLKEKLKLLTIGNVTNSPGSVKSVRIDLYLYCYYSVATDLLAIIIITRRRRRKTKNNDLHPMTASHAQQYTVL